MDERILMKYLRGEASAREREDVALWVDASPDNASTLRLLRLTYEASLMKACSAGEAAVRQTPRRRRHTALWASAVCLAAAFAAIVFIPSDRDVSVQRVCAPVGQQMTVDLSDGTVVRLNSNSELTFTDLGDKGCRRVALRGEAYFEVARDEKRPFIVETPDFDVRVLGTVFNVNTYFDRQSVVLVSGSVDISHDGETYRLRPDDMFHYDSSTGERGVSRVDPARYTSWTCGYLQFDSSGLDLVFSQMKSYFGVDFQYDSCKAASVSLVGKLELRDGLAAALDNLSSSAVISYSFKDSTTVSVNIL